MKENNKFRDELLLRVLAFDRTMVGRKLVVNYNAAIGPFNKKVDLAPYNLGQILISNRDETLPKHGVQSDRIYKKANIKYLGDCYLTITIYKISDQHKFDSITCFKFEITPFHSKTKLHKFLINSKDLEYYYGITYSDEDRIRSLKTLDLIIKKMVLKRQKIYSTIELPIQYHASLPNPMQSYHLRNTLRHDIVTSSSASKAVYGRFLTPKIKESRIIVQKVKRIGGQYLIFTIEKHNILDHWAISVYNPKTSRRFVASLYFSDILNMNPSFLEKMSPSSLKQIARERSLMTDYSRFCDYYNQYKSEREFSMQQLEFEDASNNLSLTSEFTRSVDFLGHAQPAKDTGDRVEYKDNKFNFMEIKVNFIYFYSQ